MNGISLALSKSCCPMYNLGTSKKMDLIPRRLSNFHLQRISPLVATTHMMKHRVYCKNITDSRSEVPEVSGDVVLLMFGVGIIGMTLAKAWEVVARFISTRGWVERVLKLNPCYYYIVLGVAAVFAARGFIGNFMRGFTVLVAKPFLPGDIIKVGYLEGEVIEKGLITTSLLTAENNSIEVPTSWFYGQVIMNKSKATKIVPSSWLCGRNFMNKSLAPWHSLVINDIGVKTDKIEKIEEITEEITKMIRSYSLIYLEEDQPCCYISGMEPHCVYLTLRCNLKEVCEDEFKLAQDDIVMQLIEIIKKHGGTH